jgi:hypothetical protein
MVSASCDGGDQPLQGSNLISEATVNVLEAGGRRDITRVKEERLHLCHEHISVAEEVAHLRQLRSGEYIPRLNFSDGLRTPQLCVLPIVQCTRFVLLSIGLRRNCGGWNWSTEAQRGRLSLRFSRQSAKILSRQKVISKVSIWGDRKHEDQSSSHDLSFAQRLSTEAFERLICIKASPRRANQ